MTMRTMLILAGLLMAGPASAAPGTYAPPGSYQNTCRNITYFLGVLSAECRTPKGAYYKSKIEAGWCVPGSIWNDYSELTCTAARPWGKGAALPTGSYRQTCHTKRVNGTMLTAYCKPKKGAVVPASLDLRQCQWGGAISNRDGQLICS